MILTGSANDQLSLAKTSAAMNHQLARSSSARDLGGASFKPNRRITNSESDETVSGVDGNQYGDYQGVYAASNGSFRCSWTDSRNPGAIKEDMFAGGIVF